MTVKDTGAVPMSQSFSKQTPSGLMIAVKASHDHHYERRHKNEMELVLGNLAGRLPSQIVVCTGLVVHPPSSHHCWLEGDAWLPSWLVTTALAPHEGVFMRLPVGGRGGNGLTDVGPILKPASFERQRPQEFPPRFDQVEIGGVGRLEDKLPARMGQVEQEYIHRAVGTQIVQHRVDPFDLAGQPAVYSFQEVHPVGNRAA